MKQIRKVAAMQWSAPGSDFPALKGLSLRLFRGELAGEQPGMIHTGRNQI